MKLTGVIKNGVRVYDNPAAPIIAIRDIGEGGRFVETLERFRETRSLKANARYWTVLVPLAQHFLSKTRDIPLSEDQTHFVLVSAFAGCDITPLGPVPVPTRTMDTRQFSTFCEKVQAWLSDNEYPVPERKEEPELDEASA